MTALAAYLPDYRAAFARYALAGNELAREEALFEATELGKLVSRDNISIDDLRELHRRATQALIEDWSRSGADAAERIALARLNSGDTGPFGVAFMLPHEMAQLARHEKNWRREHGKLLALFEQTDDLMLVLDGDDRIEAVNPAFVKATGWSAAEAGQHVSPVWQGLLPGTATRHLRVRQARRDGSSFMVEWSVSPIRDADGELLSQVCIGRDITREQQIQDSLRENDKLRAVATLSAGIAHDFNNLLGSINGLAELCELQAPAGSRLARNLGRIRLAGDKAAALVRRMLDFSRQTPKSVQRTTAAALLDHSRGLLNASMPQGVQLALEIERDGVMEVDLVQIEQVLLNIASNAAHAMRDSGGVVRIVVDQADPGAAGAPVAAPRHLRLRVIDSGHGIPADVLPKIFEPFFTTKPVGEGTGLGLAAAHGIVSNHGGLIEVSSTPGRGSSFDVFLPMAAPARASVVQPGAETAAAAAQAAAGAADHPAEAWRASHAAISTESATGPRT